MGGGGGDELVGICPTATLTTHPDLLRFIHLCSVWLQCHLAARARLQTTHLLTCTFTLCAITQWAHVPSQTRNTPLCTIYEGRRDVSLAARCHPSLLLKSVERGRGVAQISHFNVIVTVRMRLLATLRVWVVLEDVALGGRRGRSGESCASRRPGSFSLEMFKRTQRGFLKDPSNAPFTTSWYGSLGF